MDNENKGSYGAMGKNIILCSDGTGNTAIKDRGTNVFKLYEAVDLTPGLNQKVFYDDGVGTEQFKLIKLLGGAFGFGLSRNVRQLYASLVRVYQPGDNIYLFGFSRGAFTVRTLGGLISHCGILDMNKHCQNDADLMNKVNGAYKAYRRRYSTVVADLWRLLFKWNTRRKYGFTDVAEFRERFAVHGQQDAPIHFIGVWDTVSAVGFPIIWVKDIMNMVYRVSFPDNKLGRNVSHAYQALSIDDKRRTFHPEMWDEASNGDGENKRIVQVWFAGVHANVGGGYPKQGMSLVALDWMMEQAAARGLHFIASVRKRVADHANVNDKLYDSRSGLAVYYRYAPRNIARMSQRFHIQTPLIHQTVLLRSLDVTDGYAPGNLPKHCQFVATGKAGYVNQDALALMQQAMDKNETLLERVAGWITLRMWLHVVFLLLSVGLVCLLRQYYSLPELIAMASDSSYIKLMKAVINLLAQYTGLLPPIILVIVLSMMARRRIQDTFSSFWYSLRRKIIDAGITLP